jgi:hypothetical protein
MSDQFIKDIILKTAKEKQPETVSQLTRLVHQKTNLSEKKIINQINQLETEGKIHFNIKHDLKSVSFGTFLFRSDSVWYWSIIAVSMATAITVFTISQDLYPIIYIRNVLGVVFVLFLPGYAFAKAMFPKKVPLETSSASLDTIERLALSVGMSIALTSLIGLILYFTPLSLSLTPITLTMLVLTVGLATAALIRDYQAKSVKAT